MDKTTYRMDSGMVEVTWHGHHPVKASRDDVSKMISKTAMYLLDQHGHIEVVRHESGPIKQSVIVR